MKRRYSQLIPMAVLVAFGATSCTVSTSPATRLLDGEWTTGHACLTLGLSLNWTDADVSGTGTYRTDDGPTGCADSRLLGTSGEVALVAHRMSSTSLSGTMTFDNKTHAVFTGILTTTSGVRIDASVVPPNDTAMMVRIFEGLIP
jgi:hypothetical protein